MRRYKSCPLPRPWAGSTYVALPDDSDLVRDAPPTEREGRQTLSVP